MRRTFQNNGKGATKVKVLKDMDNTRYVRHLVIKMMRMSNINKNIRSAKKVFFTALVFEHFLVKSKTSDNHACCDDKSDKRETSYNDIYRTFEQNVANQAD